MGTGSAFDELPTKTVNLSPASGCFGNGGSRSITTAIISEFDLFTHVLVGLTIPITVVLTRL